jgi:hypothetical protein
MCMFVIFAVSLHPSFESLCACLLFLQCFTCLQSLQGIQWIQELVVMRVSWSRHPRLKKKNYNNILFLKKGNCINMISILLFLII